MAEDVLDKAVSEQMKKGRESKENPEDAATQEPPENKDTPTPGLPTDDKGKEEPKEEPKEKPEDKSDEPEEKKEEGDKPEDKSEEPKEEPEEPSPEEQEQKLKKPFSDVEAPDDEKQAKEQLKQYGVDAENLSASKVVTLLNQAKQEAQQQSPANEVAQDIENDEFLKEFYQWRKNGGEDIRELTNKFLLKDPTQLDEKERYKLYLEKRNYSNDAISEALEGWDELTTFDKESKVNEATDYLRQLHEQTKKQSQNPHTQQTQQQTEEQKRAQKDFLDKQEEKVENFGEQIKGAKVTDNLTITEEMANDLVNRAKNERVFWKKDENGQAVVDPQETFDYHLFKHYRDDIFKAHEQSVKSKVRKEVYNEVHQPSTDDRGKGAPNAGNQNQNGQTNPETVENDIRKGQAQKLPKL